LLSGWLGATPHPTCSAGHLLPQGEKESRMRTTRLALSPRLLYGTAFEFTKTDDRARGVRSFAP
jgi:hypothetical protein